MKIPVRDFQIKADNSSHKGFIAQELIEIYPDAVTKGETEDKFWSVDYGKITPLLVKSIQDLIIENDKLKAQNETIQKRIEALKNRINQKTCRVLETRQVSVFSAF